MSLVIRFSRIGKRGERKFRVVVTEKRSRRDGAPIEYLGFIEKRAAGATKELDHERIKYWISHGAQLSPAVKEIL